MATDIAKSAPTDADGNETGQSVDKLIQVWVDRGLAWCANGPKQHLLDQDYEKFLVVLKKNL